MKTCKKCKITKELSMFYNHKRQKDGKASECKECSRLYYLSTLSEEEANKIKENKKNTELGIKVCSSCNETKIITEFGKQKRGKGGIYALCKKCNNRKVAEYRKTKDGLTANIYSEQRHSTRDRNKKRGKSLLYPNYSCLELRAWIYNQDNFDELFENWENSNYDKDFKPSCDRKNNSKAYTFDNIKLMTWKENQQNAYDDMRTAELKTNHRAVVQLLKDGVTKVRKIAIQISENLK